MLQHKHERAGLYSTALQALASMFSYINVFSVIVASVNWCTPLSVLSSICTSTFYGI